jgi:hypothetical protein
VVDQTTPDEHAVVPFLRAGPPPDRTRWEGWQQWRKIRGTVVVGIRHYRASRGPARARPRAPRPGAGPAGERSLTPSSRPSRRTCPPPRGRCQRCVQAGLRQPGRGALLQVQPGGVQAVGQQSVVFLAQGAGLAHAAFAAQHDDRGSSLLGQQHTGLGVAGLPPVAALSGRLVQYEHSPLPRELLLRSDRGEVVRLACKRQRPAAPVLPQGTGLCPAHPRRPVCRRRRSRRPPT